MKNNSSLSKRIGKIALIVLCAILALVLLVLLLAPLVTTIIFHDFFKDAEKEFRIPGLSDGVVPQGFTYLADDELYLQCGYMADGESASRIYIIPEADPSSARYVSLLDKNGNPYTGHTGGITSDGTLVWMANDGEGEDNCVWVMSLNELLSAKNGDEIKLETSFTSESRAAYCYVDGDVLWVGEFYRPVDYPTKDSHALTANGAEHHAIICAYTLDATSQTGIRSGAPRAILSVTDHVQGFARTQDGGFILSTSYGLSKSHWLFYDNVMENSADTSLNIDGTDVPVWFLDENSLLRDLECPPMSEEIVIRDDRIYYLTESACKKYIFGSFIRGRHVYSLPLDQ
jgi:hypothetical protein